MCIENKGANQMYSYYSADLRLCFLICKNPVFLMWLKLQMLHFKRINSTHPYTCCVYIQIVHVTVPDI